MFVERDISGNTLGEKLHEADLSVYKRRERVDMIGPITAGVRTKEIDA